MTEIEAQLAAEALIATLDMRGHTATFVEAKPRVRYPGEWSAIFDVFSLEGTPVDGPMVVIVDEITKQARIMESP